MIYPRIRELRKEKHCTQEEVASYLHVAQNTYSQYETGKISITAGTVSALSDFFDVSADYIMGISDERNPEKHREI